MTDPKAKSGKREMACAVAAVTFAFWAVGSITGNLTVVGIGDTMWPGAVVLLATAFGMESIATQFRR